MNFNLLFLRYLDPVTLLNVSRTSDFMRDVCYGDPRLRKTLAAAIKNEQNAVIDFILNPTKITTATRIYSAQLFSRNMQELKKNQHDIKVHKSRQTRTREGRKKERSVTKRKIDVRPYRL